MHKPTIWSKESSIDMAASRLERRWQFEMTESESLRLLELQRIEREREMAKRDTARGVK